MPKSRITLKTIAEKAGVSTMTVSNALRDNSNVSREVKSRILATAKRLGYRPDPILARLMSHLRPSRIRRYQAALAFVTSESAYYSQELLEGAKIRAAELGYSVDRIGAHELNVSPSRRMRVLKARGIEGVLLGPLVEPGPADFVEDWQQFSVISLSYSIISPQFHMVVPSQFRNTMEALRQMRLIGVRRPALIVPEHFEERVFHTTTAAMAWDAHAHGQRDVLTFALSEAAQKPRAWLDQHHPDALLISDVFTANKFFEGLGVSPDKSPLPLYGLLLDQKVLRVGVNQNAQTVGRVGVDQLVGLLQRGERGPPATRLVTMVDGTWRGRANDKS